MSRRAPRRDRRTTTLHDELGTEPASAAGAATTTSAPAVRRVAAAVGGSALLRTSRLVDDGLGLEALLSLPAAQAAQDVVTRQAVLLARAQGVTWAQVGDVFGVTRQRAQQRWGGTR